MKRTKRVGKGPAPCSSAQERSPLIEAARAIGTVIGKVSSGLGIASPVVSSPPRPKPRPPSKAAVRPKRARAAKSSKAAKSPASKKR